MNVVYIIYFLSKNWLSQNIRYKPASLTRWLASNPFFLLIDLSKLQKSKLNTEKIKINQNKSKNQNYEPKPIQNAKSCGIIKAWNGTTI